MAQFFSQENLEIIQKNRSAFDTARRYYAAAVKACRISDPDALAKLLEHPSLKNDTVFLGGQKKSLFYALISGAIEQLKAYNADTEKAWGVFERVKLCAEKLYENGLYPDTEAMSLLKRHMEGTIPDIEISKKERGRAVYPEDGESKNEYVNHGGLYRSNYDDDKTIVSLEYKNYQRMLHDLGIWLLYNRAESRAQTDERILQNAKDFLKGQKKNSVDLMAEKYIKAAGDNERLRISFDKRYREFEHYRKTGLLTGEGRYVMAGLSYLWGPIYSSLWSRVGRVARSWSGDTTRFESKTPSLRVSFPLYPPGKLYGVNMWGSHEGCIYQFSTNGLPFHLNYFREKLYEAPGMKDDFNAWNVITVDFGKGTEIQAGTKPEFPWEKEWLKRRKDLMSRCFDENYELLPNEKLYALFRKELFPPISWARVLYFQDNEYEWSVEDRENKTVVLNPVQYGVEDVFVWGNEAKRYATIPGIDPEKRRRLTALKMRVFSNELQPLCSLHKMYKKAFPSDVLMGIDYKSKDDLLFSFEP